jgi:aminomethyltransferase
MVKDISKLAIGQVAYLCWCDDDGKVVDDGTVSRLGESAYRVTAAEPSLAWFQRHSRGYRVTLEDSTERIAALSVQGPRSRAVLQEVADADLGSLKFFHFRHTRIDGKEAIISRTGYTGDLGYEVWVDAPDAVALWDRVARAGKPHGLLPAGLDALDMTRVEAGFIMNGVDYFSANHCLIESRKSTPHELALGWTVNLDREPFIGQAALRREKVNGSKRAFVGLVVDWDRVEALFARHGLPPEVPAGAWRDARPVYNRDGRRIGQATSGAFSPLLKRNLMLATVEAPYRKIGATLQVEITMEYDRLQVPAVVTKKPFFDPPRKRA